jgi:hypothetical protein
MPVTADIPEDAEVKRLVDAARAPFLARTVQMEGGMPFAVQKLNKPIDAVIGHTHTRLYRTASLQSPFNDLVTDSLRKFAKTELAVTPGFRFGATVPEKDFTLENRHVADGAITLEDLYRFFPVIYTLSAGMVTGANLQNNIEALLTEVYSTDVFRQAGGWVSGFGGFEARVDLSRPDGQRVLELRRLDGKIIGKQDRLSIAGCSRPLEGSDTLCSMKGFESVRGIGDPATGDTLTIVDFLTRVLAKEPVPAELPRVFMDESGYRAWPVDPFVQPLTGVGR